MPFPSPGDLPDPGIEPGSPTLQAESLPSEPPGKILLPGGEAEHLTHLVIKVSPKEEGKKKHIPRAFQNPVLTTNFNKNEELLWYKKRPHSPVLWEAAPLKKQPWGPPVPHTGHGTPDHKRPFQARPSGSCGDSPWGSHISFHKQEVYK